MKMDKHVVQNLAMITQVGVSMLAPIILCLFIGCWLDERYGWQTTIPLLILGILGGGRNTWLLLKELAGIKGEEHEKDIHKGKG